MKTILIFLLFTLIACSEPSTSTSEYRIPVIKECKRDLIDWVENGKFSKYIEGQFFEFTDSSTYMQYPNLVGYMVIKLKGKTTNKPRDDIGPYITTIILDCYPTTAAIFKKTELGNNVTQLIEEFSKYHGINDIYLVIENDKLRAHYRPRPGSELRR